MESLHNHTTVSDGQMSARELLETGKKLGYSCLAFCDHDSVMPLDVRDDLLANPIEGMRWVSGVELSLSGGNDIHLVGLFVDPSHPDLQMACEARLNFRIQRMNLIVDHLRGLGFTVTPSDVEEEAGDGAIGRPHIVRALARYPQNTVVAETLFEQMKQDPDPQWTEKVASVEARPQQLPYMTFLSRDAYKPMPHISAPHLDLEGGCELIHKAGGLAILAHPYTSVPRSISFPEIEKAVEQGSLDGFEEAFGVDNYECAQFFAHLKVRHPNLLVSASADAHTKQHLMDWEPPFPTDGLCNRLKERLADRLLPGTCSQ